MNVAELERYAEHIHGNAVLPAYMVRSLARRVIAAERLVEALEYIGKQKKTLELETEYDVDVADFEDEYDTCIDRARAALTAYREASK